jgi:hypothetical protein
MLLGLVLVARLAWVQLASLNLPIFAHDGHHWRQSFTFGVAWNYAHTTHDVLRPRMFLELASSNIIAMEVPVYPLLTSVLLRISGDSVVGPRLVSWLALVATVLVLFRILGIGRTSPRDAWADRAALLVAVSVSTMIAVDFRSIQPEPMAAGLSMVAADRFIRYRDSERRRDAIVGAVFTILAILTKPLVLGIVPGLVLFAVWGPGRWARRGLVVSTAILPGIVMYAAWDRWAAYLLRTEMHGLAIIAIEHDALTMLRNLKNVGYAREAILHFLPNYAGSWWLTPAFAAGIYRGLAEPRLRRFAVPFLVWLVGYLFELLAFGDRLHSNAYYFILAPAPVAFFCALGVGGFLRSLDSSEHRPPVTAYRVGLAVGVLLPLGLLAAKRSNWSSIDPKDLGFDRNSAVWTNDIGLMRLLLGLLVAIALGPTLRPLRVPKWLGVAVAIAVLSSGLWALRDAGQYMRYYTAIDKRARFTAELATLRAAVDKYSRIDDRVVTNVDEMFPLYYALRNGFRMDDLRTPAKIAGARARGARLYLHVDPFEGEPTLPQMRGPLLEHGRWWRIYCIDTAGCPAR